MQSPLHIAFVGFGEAAIAFTKGWQDIHNLSVSAFDIKTECGDAKTRATKHDEYSAFGVKGADNLCAAVKGADAIFSLVTADQASAAANAVAAQIDKGSFFFDCNSCAPGTKQRSARRINDAGGRYVDVAVMAPVYPKLHRTPILVCGSHSPEAMAVFDLLQMNATAMDSEIGGASSVKMIRSVMMKGLEALFAECVLAGREAGVDEQVLASLDATYPGLDFMKRASYSFERMTAHGKRRAEEMKEVALTIEELGLPNEMAQATVQWQQRISALGLVASEDDYKSWADDVLARLHVTCRERETSE